MTTQQPHNYACMTYMTKYTSAEVFCADLLVSSGTFPPAASLRHTSPKAYTLNPACPVYFMSQLPVGQPILRSPLRWQLLQYNYQ